MARVRCVSIVGNSGAGKSTLGRALARRLGVEFFELDSVYHQPGWVPLDGDEFRSRVVRFIDEHPTGWVIDGNYSLVRDAVWSRADTVVWLDLPRATVMSRVIRRTVRRAVTREELWNGNREPVRNFTSLKMEENIIVWAWKRHGVYRERYQQAAAAPEWAHLEFVRVGRAADQQALLSAATRDG